MFQCCLALLAVVLLYRFVLRLMYDPRTAFIAALIFALMPLYVVLSQQFMPDVMMLSLTVGAIFFLYVWHTDDRLLSSDRFRRAFHARAAGKNSDGNSLLTDRAHFLFKVWMEVP